jgi:hypothetical protein
MLDVTPALRAVTRRRLEVLARMDSLAAQRATLGRLLRRAAGTRFGRDHGFESISSVREYQARVKLRTYEDFQRDYFEPDFPVMRNTTWPGLITAYAQSSGTTGGITKRVPVSRAGMRSNSGASLDMLGFHLAARPESRVAGGTNVLLGGSTSLDRLAPGVVAGDLSGIAAARLPLWVRPLMFPPRELALIGDWESKMAAMAPASLEFDVRSVSGTPSWMLLFFERVAGLRPGRKRRLVEYWPNLELLVHGGVSLTPYRDAIMGWLEGSHAETREVYPASEGFIATADRGPGEGMRMVLDRGIFYEFVRPEELDRPDPDRRWLGTAEVGVEYAIVLSTDSGLWSYVIGDTVKLIELDPPRLLITGRTSFFLSGFGEHVAAHELDEATAEAARAVGATVTDYAAAPLYPQGDRARGGHLFVVELSRPAADEEARFGEVLDRMLAGTNLDYADHRRGDFAMAPPEVVLVRPGTFERWMASRGKLGGQNKVPRVINDPELLAGLRAFVAEHG